MVTLEISKALGANSGSLYFVNNILSGSCRELPEESFHYVKAISSLTLIKKKKNFRRSKIILMRENKKNRQHISS